MKILDKIEIVNPYPTDMEVEIAKPYPTDVEVERNR